MDFCVEGRRVTGCVCTGAAEAEEEEAPTMVGGVQRASVEGADAGCGTDGGPADTNGGTEAKIVGDVAAGAGEKEIADVMTDEETTEGEESVG
ncbi:hypothetical protein M5689_010933 [Euphorbia peplus]|nr:hypothetical protein M5689_010933 [Euphorbia peplus]